MRQIGFQQSFNVGELSPDAWARSDLAQHSKGCRLGFNMIARVAGPIGRRPGTWFAGLPLYNHLPAEILPFRRSIGDALLLEFGHLYMRVRTVDGTLVTSGGMPVQITTPWTSAQIGGLRIRQVGDVVYVTHRDGLRPYTLKRLSNTSWSLDPTVFIDGPWRPDNANLSHILTEDGTAILSNIAFFTPAHVGSLLRLKSSRGNPNERAWEPDETISGAGAYRVSNGRVYRSTGAGTTGNSPPVHDIGKATDGSVEWEFWHDGAGVFRVTGYNSATSVEKVSLGGNPANLTLGTPYWAEGAFSDVYGWPTAWPAVREERLALAAPAAEPDVIHFTRTSGFTPDALDFKPGLGTGRVVDTDAVRRYVGDERNRIVWIESTTQLLVGTVAGEFLVSGATIDDPISPASNAARPLTEFGVADIAPQKAFDGLLFVAAGMQTLRYLAVSPDASLGGRELSEVVGHIMARKITDIAWMKQPWNALWCILGDGGAAVMSFHAEQQVLGWTQQAVAARETPTELAPLGGGMTIESQCVVPGVDGRPRLFMIAHRVKGGVSQRLLLRLSDPEDRLFLDAAEAYVGAAVNGVAALDHLTQEAVTVMAATEAGAATAPGAGWGEYRDRMVSGGGAVTLPDGMTATRLYAGLPYKSRWEGLPPEFAPPGGTTGKIVRYTHAEVIMDVAVAYWGTTGVEGDADPDRILTRAVGDTGGPRLARRAVKVNLGGGAERDRRVFVETDHGWDMVVHAVRPQAQVND